MAKENIVIFSKAIMIDKALAEKVAALAAKANIKPSQSTEHVIILNGTGGI